MDRLPKNRSVPSSTVIPVLSYPDVRRAVKWLADVFGFKERLQIADHRAQLVIGDGAMIVAEYIDRERRRHNGRCAPGSEKNKYLPFRVTIPGHHGRNRIQRTRYCTIDAVAGSIESSDAFERLESGLVDRWGGIPYGPSGGSLTRSL